jgi:protein LSM14
MHLFYILEGSAVSPRQNSGRQQKRQSANASQSRAEPLKFEGEYDFEQANAKFEELEKEFTDKLKVKDDKKSERKENSANVSLPAGEEQHLSMKEKMLAAEDNKKEELTREAKDAEENKHFYDKNTSFFDRISCESNEKAQQRQVKNWKEEKKLNAETFGLREKMLAYNQSRVNYNRNGSGRQQGRINNNHNNSNNNRSYNNNNNNSSNNGQNRYNQPQRYNQNGQPSRGFGNNNNNGYGNNNGYRRNEVEVDSRQSGFGYSNRRMGSR